MIYLKHSNTKLSNNNVNVTLNKTCIQLYVSRKLNLYFYVLEVSVHVVNNVYNTCRKKMLIFKSTALWPLGLYNTWDEIIVTPTHRNGLESIQRICKRPTYRFEDTIVWKRWHFWRSEINIGYRLIQCVCISGFCSSPCPSSNVVYRSLESTWIDSNWVRSTLPVFVVVVVCFFVLFVFCLWFFLLP